MSAEQGLNRHIRFLGIGLMVCFVALFVQLNRVQIWGQERLQANPNNNRAIVRDFTRERGDILTADGVVIAQTFAVEGDLERERRYPEGALYAHTTGFFSLQFGAGGLERQYNELLAGQTGAQKFDSVSDIFTETNTTANLTISIRHDAQQAARDALGDRRGSVVALDPRTGEILAMWSNPSWDPNVVSSVDLDAAQAEWFAFNAVGAGDDPRLARSFREIYFPGSTFKVVTGAAGLDTNRVTATEPVFPVVSQYVAPLTTVPLGNFGGSSCGGNLIDILRVSCNTAFAEMGAEILGAGPMIDSAERFGFNSTPPIDLPGAAASNFPTDFGAFNRTSDGTPPIDILDNQPALAQAAIGQNDVKATPLQMALVAGGIANGGVIMKPHVMVEFRDQSGNLVEEYDPEPWLTAVGSQDAAVLRDGMLAVVGPGGTAQSMVIPGQTVGAKTGTAQVDAARPNDTHAWIIAFAGPEGGEAEIAIAVLLESVPGAGQQTGGTNAAPIARAVLEVLVAS